MKKNSWMLFLFFAFGIVAVNYLGKDWFLTYGGIDSYVLQEISFQKISYDRYFWYVLVQRVKIMLLLFFMARAVSSKILVYGCEYLLSFSFGWMLALTVLENGVKGIAVVLAGVLPHGILYLLAFYVWQKNMLAKTEKGIPARCHRSRRQKMNLAERYVLIVVLVLTGVVLESYAGPLILKK